MVKKGRAWRDRQNRDPYVRDARAQGYRSRSAFKLKDLQLRDRLIVPGMRVVDLGAAPGGWSQVITECLNGRGYLVTVDRLAMDPIVGAVSLVGDLADPVVMDAVVGALGGAPADLIVSDMAPDLTGIREADQARHAALVHLALEVAARALKRGGMCVFKVFYGSMFESLLKEIKPCFNSVGIRKPKASRAESREVYWVLKGYTGYILT